MLQSICVCVCVCVCVRGVSSTRVHAHPLESFRTTEVSRIAPFNFMSSVSTSLALLRKSICMG